MTLACHRNYFILLNTLCTFELLFAYTNTKTQISSAVATVELYIVQFFYFLISKFQTYGHVLWTYSLVCVG